MSVISAVLTKVKPVQASDIAAQLAQAEQLVADLERRHGNLALDALAGGVDAARALAAIKPELAAGRERVAELRGADLAAKARDEEAVNAQRAALQRTQINAVRKHLEARDKAAAALSAALTEVCAQYRILVERSEKARSACPIGRQWPTGTLCEIDPIRKLVAREMFRLSGDADGNLGNPRALPGSQSPSAQYLFQPEVLPPLVDDITKASAFVIAQLTGAGKAAA